MNFVELVRRATQESGTVPRPGPPTVTGQTDILAKWVDWVRSSWMDIQTAEPDWLWLRREAEGVLVTGQNRFTPAALGADLFRSWRPWDEYEWDAWTLYDPAIGLRDEQTFEISNYGQVRRYARGEVETARPQWGAIDEAGNLFVWPRPDKEYRLRFVYNRAPQILRADLDVPEMPEHHHELIVYKALIKATVYDEGLTQFEYWRSEAARMMADLRDTQLPRLVMGGPLA